ncbi:hypothetical protein [Deinococcus apachensis]|uniref:hypothetical protein n=1 Tax=Deinococcus apachensis TaxID=309886 RepID=UPI000373EE36|nr:hypothetical protein [Deinococcus apachensis]
MTDPRRFLLPALLLALPSCAASATTIPARLVGEWISGAQLAPKTYEAEFSRAWADSTRLVLNKDGTYTVTTFEATAFPAFFGTTGRMITCESLDVGIERGRFTVQGNKLTLRAETFREIKNISPDRLNNGCTRRAGSDKTSKDNAVNQATWQLTGGKLNLTFGKTPMPFLRRTPEKPAAPAPGSSTLPAELRGEWHSGRISPVEYYNVTTGKWAEASGTSILLKLNPNLTYERTGLLVVTTYGCTSKLLVQEQGKVAVNGSSLTFTPTSSASTGYTCSPSKVSSSKNSVKPYTERALVKVNPDGQHVLSLASGSGETLFNRPLGTPPESAPGTGRGTVTPPAPGASGSPTPSYSTPNSSAGTTPSPTPAKWMASGTWDAVLTVNEQTYRVQFKLQDDSPRILGYGDDPVEYANGNSETGALEIGLEVGGRTMELKVQGRFEGDRYQGQVRWTTYEGEDLGRGTLSMTRR